MEYFVEESDVVKALKESCFHDIWKLLAFLTQIGISLPEEKLVGIELKATEEELSYEINLAKSSRPPKSGGPDLRHYEFANIASSEFIKELEEKKKQLLEKKKSFKKK